MYVEKRVKTMHEMTELHGVLLTGEELKNFDLPIELIRYLSESKRMKTKILESLINDIEDLYRYFKLLYDFSDIEFSALAISCLERANDTERFYFYVKKTLEANMNFSPKHTEREIVVIEKSTFDSIAKQVSEQYIELVNALYYDTEVDLTDVNRAFAKLELLLSLKPDAFLNKLLESGNKVLTKYIEKRQSVENQENEADSQGH
jgi:hypothetical protein